MATRKGTTIPKVFLIAMFFAIGILIAIPQFRTSIANTIERLGEASKYQSAWANDISRHIVNWLYDVRNAPREKR